MLLIISDLACQNSKHSHLFSQHTEQRHLSTVNVCVHARALGASAATVTFGASEIAASSMTPRFRATIVLLVTRLLLRPP